MKRKTHEASDNIFVMLKYEIGQFNSCFFLLEQENAKILKKIIYTQINDIFTVELWNINQFLNKTSFNNTNNTNVSYEYYFGTYQKFKVQLSDLFFMYIVISFLSSQQITTDFVAKKRKKKKRVDQLFCHRVSLCRLYI